jgi:GNAT superfamily N-acetyltransferase
MNATPISANENVVADHDDNGVSALAPVDLTYPKELEANVGLDPRRTLNLRPIRGDDEERLLTFHSHLSDDSIYRRYFGFHRQLSSDEVKHLTHVDYNDRLALVIEDRDEIVGVARYDRYPGTSVAEVAFVVRDDYQHLGLGHRLFASLAAAAAPRGITVFTAVTLCRNNDMMSVFRHSGFPITSSVSAGEINVRLSIGPCGVALFAPLTSRDDSCT